MRDYLRVESADLAHLPIFIKAFANGDDMPKFLSNAGVVQSSQSLWNFAEGFSQAHALSDFVFVGNGRDRADKKIKGEETILSLHLSPLIARKVFLNSL